MLSSYSVCDGRYLVTGAAGYVGQRVVQALVRGGAQLVVASDVRNFHAVEGSKQQLLDLRDASTVDTVLRDTEIDCVVHIASYGMSGREMHNAQLTRAVNVGGTQNICNACVKHRVKRLIYISTVNVCFDGTEVFDGSAQADYAYQHCDAYSATKREAEILALSFAKQGKLAVVSLRPYGIYGEAEERHFPRMIRYMSWGLFAKFGAQKDLSDWVHVDNLVHAILLADAKLQRKTLSGEAFFIGDNVPINTIDLCAVLNEMVTGQPVSSGGLWIPYHFMYGCAYLFEWVYWGLYRAGMAFDPLLSRAEVNKVARTHYWNPERARLLLGYEPIVSRQEGLERMYSYFRTQLKKEGYPQKYQQFAAKVKKIIAVIILIILVLLILIRMK